jgi:eukaryotic-like serine/threonine-protein kinase
LLEPGQIFAARYRVNRRIAEGGMGAIFEAEHTATERKVALKLLFPHIMSVASARKKFELEAKISARVNSPNIVEVLDAGFDEATKSPFLVMELLEGQTLAQLIRDRGPLGLDQALPLLSQVAAGLDAAHGYREPSGTAKPIVHRDLKPENLFMSREHGAVVVKILDYGIAKVLGETGNISQEVRGTPLYMAFEQVTAGPLSPQTDVWALGLIAYFVLTGCHYWRSANEPSANVQSLFAEILSLPLEAASVRLRQYNSTVQLPLAFDDWLLECIQRDPAQRFPSAGAAIEALAKASGQSPRVRPRFDSMPAAPVAFAATEAFQSPPAAPASHLGTAASLPGIASERMSSAAPAGPTQRKPRLAVPAAAGGALLIAGISWLALRSSEPESALPSAPSSASSAASSGAPSHEQPLSLKPTAAHEPRIAPAEPTPPDTSGDVAARPPPSASAAATPPFTQGVAAEAVAPPTSPAATPSAGAPPPTAPLEATPRATTPLTLEPASPPQIRVAPRGEPTPDVAHAATQTAGERPPASKPVGVAPTATATARTATPGPRAPAPSPAPAAAPARTGDRASKKTPHNDPYRMR